MLPFALVLLTGSGPSLAAAPLPDPLPAGTAFVLTGIDKQDAFYRERKSLVGLACRVAAPGLDPNDRKHFGGPVVCNDGEDYYFYKIRLEVLDEEAALAARVPAVALPSAATGEVPAPLAAVADQRDRGVPGTADEAAPREALRRGTPPRLAPESTSQTPTTAASAWPTGARARIASVSAEDAYAQEAAVLKGKTCAVADQPLSESGNGWWSGQLQCDDGTGYYFYQVSLTPTASAASATGTLAAGKLVKVLAVDALDTLYPLRSALEGHTCSVSEAPMVPSGPDLYAGRLFCDDGKQWQVFRVKVAAP